jgi:hypothetical protein
MISWKRGLPLVIVFAFLLLAAANLHPMGHPEQTEMDDYFIGGVKKVCGEACGENARNVTFENGEKCCQVAFGAQEELGVNNVVTAVVFDYRGFDTLGEATVLFAAITSVFTVFWGRIK